MGYSRADAKGGWCFFSGVTRHDYATMAMPRGIAAQARNCVATIHAVLAEGGIAMGDVVRVQCAVTDAAVADSMVPVLGDAFDEVRPAATIVLSGSIQPEMLVAIDVTVLKE